MSEPIKMISKDGEERMVHPVNIRAYQRQGWEIVQPAPEPSPELAIKIEEPAVVVAEEAPAADLVAEVIPKRKTVKKSRKK
jgi:hypothetical protein